MKVTSSAAVEVAPLFSSFSTSVMSFAKGALFVSRTSLPCRPAVLWDGVVLWAVQKWVASACWVTSE
jgi:hypothetical protein